MRCSCSGCCSRIVDVFVVVTVVVGKFSYSKYYFPAVKKPTTRQGDGLAELSVVSLFRIIFLLFHLCLSFQRDLPHAQ